MDGPATLVPVVWYVQVAGNEQQPGKFNVSRLVPVVSEEAVTSSRY
jgi:hypothetical protein